jgi:hypothetical protein
LRNGKVGNRDKPEDHTCEKLIHKNITISPSATIESMILVMRVNTYFLMANNGDAAVYRSDKRQVLHPAASNKL